MKLNNLSDKDKDAFGLVKRAADVHATYPEIRVARFEALWPDDDPARPPSRKRIAVQPGTRTFFQSLRHSTPRQLSPGGYSVANLFLGVESVRGEKVG